MVEYACMDEWMNEWMNEWVSDWMKDEKNLAIQSTNVNVLISLITNGWICMYGWMNQRMKEGTNESDWMKNEKNSWLSKVQT